MSRKIQEIILGSIALIFGMIGMLYTLSVLFKVNFDWSNLWIFLISVIIVRLIGYSIHSLKKDTNKA